jgi:4-amino-4-deoxy-L-arabinose transferase-like glycosyltransferase
MGLCVLIACMLYLPGLGRPALWEPDEGRYAEIAREMVQSGDFVTPRDDWVRYFEKPPLMYWASAAAIKLLGTNEFAARLPAALFTIGQVAITYALAEEMFGIAAGAAAAVSLALSPLFFGFGRSLTLDPALAFFIEAALAAFYMAARAAPALDNDGARRWLYLAASMTALGTLTKGPVALVISGAIALIYLILERRVGEIVRIPWPRCAFIYLAIVAPWFVLVSRRNPDFLGFFFVHEHLQRYVNSTEHAQRVYFFIPVTLAGMWPWIYFIPRAIAQLRSSDRADLAPHNRSVLRFLLLWFVLVFVFFSIPHSKLGSYILPGLPPLAILAGYGLSSLTRDQQARARPTLRGFALVSTIVAAITIPTLVGISWHNRTLTLGVEGAIALIALACGAIGASVIARDSRRILISIGAIVVASLVVCGVMTRVRADASDLISYRELARSIAPEIVNGCTLASYHHHVQSLPFYTGAREVLVNHRGELAPGGTTPDSRASFIDTDRELIDLWGSDRCVVLIANRSDLVALTTSLKPLPLMLGAEGKKVALSNRPRGK